MYKARRTIRRNIFPTREGSAFILEMKCVSCQSTPTAGKTNQHLHLIPVHPKYGQKRPESSPVPSQLHHLSGQASVMPAHLNSQMHHPKSQNNLQASANSRSNEQSFAAALRSLAKQQIDVKDEEMVQQGGEGKNSSSNPRSSEKEIEASRQVNASRGIQYDNRPTDMRNLPSPQPPEKKVRG
jgi:hypothetical protein